MKVNAPCVRQGLTIMSAMLNLVAIASIMLVSMQSHHQSSDPSA